MGFRDQIVRAFTVPNTRQGQMPGTIPPNRPVVGSDRSVTVDEALCLAAVHSALAITATAVKQLGVQAFDADGKQLEAVPSIIRKPDNAMSRSAWLEMLVMSLRVMGEAFVLTRRNARGEVQDAKILDPTSINIIEQDGFGNATRFRRGEKDYPADGTGVTEGIYHAKMMRRPGKLHGVGPLQENQDALRGALDASRFANAWFRRGGVPTGTLTTNMTVTPDTAKQVKKEWNDVASQGEGVAILSGGLQYARTMITPSEAQFLETQQFYVAQVARIFRMEPSLLNAPANSGGLTYQNLESAEIRWIRYGLMDIVTEIDDMLTFFLPGGKSAKLHLDVLLRPDTKTRTETEVMAVNAGIMLLNEARELENRRPLTAAEIAAFYATKSKGQQTKDTTP